MSATTVNPDCVRDERGHCTFHTFHQNPITVGHWGVLGTLVNAKGTELGGGVLEWAASKAQAESYMEQLESCSYLRNLTVYEVDFAELGDEFETFTEEKEVIKHEDAWLKADRIILWITCIMVAALVIQLIIL